jgi:hypothetical protein
MVPKAYGGHEEDLDTFFDVVLTLSRADASMGWLTGFLIEHNPVGTELLRIRSAVRSLATTIMCSHQPH